MTDSLKTSLKC